MHCITLAQRLALRRLAVSRSLVMEWVGCPRLVSGTSPLLGEPSHAAPSPVCRSACRGCRRLHAQFVYWVKKETPAP